MVELVQGKYEEAKAYVKARLKQDYFEFEFAYVSSQEVFREINRFIWESRHEMTRYKNKYFGPVLIDISAWNDNYVNEYFKAFMYYLKDREFPKLMFMVDDMCSMQLKDALEKFFEIQMKELDFENKKSQERKIGFTIERKENEYVRS